MSHRLGCDADTTSYSDCHHTAADALDKADPALLRKSVASMVTLNWAFAEMPERIR